MTSQLDQLKAHTTVVADSGAFETIRGEYPTWRREEQEQYPSSATSPN